MLEKTTIAIGLPTKNDAMLLGPTFDRLWPVDRTDTFADLLSAIDDADRQLQAGPEIIIDIV